jgi:hypothetical protein
MISLFVINLMVGCAIEYTLFILPCFHLTSSIQYGLIVLHRKSFDTEETTSIADYLVDQCHTTSRPAPRKRQTG